MEEIFENSILDELFEARSNGFPVPYTKKYGKKEEKYFSQLEENIEKSLDKVITDSKIKEDIISKFNELRCEESIYWDKAYYKLGILDGIKLVSEAKKMENSLK